MKAKKHKVPRTINIGQDDLLVVKVGTEKSPASYADIASIQVQLAHIKANPDLMLVTHHAIDFIVLKRALLKNAIVTSGDILEEF